MIEFKNSFDKIGWEIDVEKNRIRLVPENSFSLQNPPEILYYGTSVSFLSSILKD